jgi:microcystin-dependent protein
MAQAFIGEIRCFGFNFAPVGWAFCNGQLIAISQNNALFQLIGTTYGGDGQSTFALPNLQGRIPMHWGAGPGGFNTIIGQVQGTSSATLTTNQIPAHAHAVNPVRVLPGGALEHLAAPSSAAFISNSNPDAIYNTAPTIDTPFWSNTIGPTGGSQPHDNMQPYLALNFCISLFGIFPSQT